MHEGVSTENEGMVVHSGHRCGCGSTNVGEDRFTGCIRADAPKIGVVERGLSGLVKSRVLRRHAITVEICCRRRIPSQPETVHVKETVASGDLVLCCDLVWVVGKELGEIAVTQL